jgi:RNA polymerase sigma factor (sigma-70 family)
MSALLVDVSADADLCGFYGVGARAVPPSVRRRRVEPAADRSRKQGMGRRPLTAAAVLASPRMRETARERWATVTTVALDDADLASWFASGDADSVRVVYQTYGRLVYSIAYKVLGDAGLAEDATQQTFVQAWRAAGSYDPSRALGAWLTTIAKRVAIDVHRRERRHRNLDNVDTSDSSTLVTLPPSAEQIHDVAEVRRALDDLPSTDRELIRLQHFDELTHAEIAAQLEIPLGTVKSRTFRAHKRLAGLLSHLRAEPADSGPVPAIEGGPDVRR